ncbi:glycosyl transferase [Leptothermofonsia sichuanensis E412]|uniref:glycosyl transferase n=1 Tax=Leptothermofonsia sichuanensis TaxID=2917832 RepID=UPI001CA6BD31|nr:glycosyl transferase [Leptothermofonsia sichuanensis]QZZ20805.1 glycosyl transferase [Leptothermofonsia sichuanensis E412]
MPYPILYIAVTNHGFGHATRSAAIAAEVKRLCPDITVILATTAPYWLLESYIQTDFIHRPRAFDVGVLQSDSVTMDKSATLEKLHQIRSQQNSLIASEVSFLKQNRVGLILADIPPIATLMAKAAGIPCWMCSNFGFDFIYRPWGGAFVEIADWVADCFRQCDRLFRLPLHEPMSAFPVVTDVGFTGGSPRYSIEEVRERFEISVPQERTVLMTFGGLGLSQIPYHNLERFPDWQFLTFDRNAPALPNLRQIIDNRYRPVDLMPICGRVLSKPGYSTFSEACRTGTPLISITRDDFAEARILIECVQHYLPHQVLTPSEFFEGPWEFLHQPMQPPQPPQEAVTDGNQTVAQAVINFLQSA